jgi:hypothetical protein
MPSGQFRAETNSVPCRIVFKTKSIFREPLESSYGLCEEGHKPAANISMLPKSLDFGRSGDL